MEVKVEATLRVDLDKWREIWSASEYAPESEADIDYYVRGMSLDGIRMSIYTSELPDGIVTIVSDNQPSDPDEIPAYDDPVGALTVD
jgi:hypothetical protein